MVMIEKQNELLQSTRSFPMPNLTESQIEQFAIDLLKSLGWNYVFGPDIAPDSENRHLQIINRKSFSDVLLYDVMKSALSRINSEVDEVLIDDAISAVRSIASPDLIANNEAFHRMLTDGVNVSYREGGQERGEIVRLVDFDNPGNNDFLAVNQFTVIENNINKRPDIVLFVNGMPLVVIELKNPADENATIFSAFNQIRTYKQTIPSLFVFNELLVVSDGLEAKAGSLSSGFDRFMAWKTIDGKRVAPGLMSMLEVLVKGMFKRDIFLDLIRSFVVFEKHKKEDVKTGQMSIETIKIVASYHQYYAVNKAIESTVRAMGRNMIAEPPAEYGLPSVDKQPEGDKKAGVVWHTQGAGKSLSMVFYSGKAIREFDNPTIVVITDRNDLDDQLFDTFASAKQLLRQEPVQAESRQNLKSLLKRAAGGIIFSTIHKFYPEEGNVFDELTDRKNVIVVVDEAHRTQYGFRAKIDKATGEVKYGFAKYLRDALPNATFIGFTGTPIEKEDRNTPAVFGNYIDVYDIAMAVEDKVTVPIYYESRLAKVRLSEEGRELIRNIDSEIDDKRLSDSEELKRKWSRLEALVGAEERMKIVARDIVKHFEERQKVIKGKAMVVAMSRRIAARLYDEIVALRPDWHSGDLRKGKIKVVMTVASSDGPDIARFQTSKRDRRMLADRMRSQDDELQMVIVRDMWLTGFDVPMLHTMYIDKPMRGHNLMQAIARVNRVYKDKPGGLIVDYLGIASDLKEALSFYSESGGRGDPAKMQEEAVSVMLEKYEIVSQMFFGFDYRRYFSADTGERLSIILSAQEHILSQENGRNRFIDAVTALSKAMALAIPHEEALRIKEDVAFFQAVKARLVKFSRRGGGRSFEEMELAVKQVIDEAIVANGIVDVFGAAGLKRPDISVLSDEFLEEVRNMKHKHIALEVLKKLLDDEIKGRRKVNLVKSKSFEEMIEYAIKRYQNKVLTAAEVIEELIKIAKEIKDSDKEPEEMGLSGFEYAFYSAVANNESARELMGKEKLRELAVVLYDKVRKNASIDWTIRENAKAKLRVIVKRTLRQYGYPPDMQKLATETVLKQAELIAEELTKNS